MRPAAAHGGAERRFWQSQAGAFGGRLRAGAPCPVCGSAQHPQPAAGGGRPGQKRSWIG